jgi:DNA-directed RNA polymerase specialized sigma24 family protein
MLDELCKRDKEWRKMAFHFCKSKELADDIVQDMYLKFANYNKPINDHYIFFALKTIFLDYLRIDKRIQTINIDLFPFEVQKKICEINYDFYDYDTDYLKELTLTKVKELPYFERELLTVTQEISQRQLARETDIAFVVINQTIKKTKKQLWQEIKKIKD